MSSRAPTKPNLQLSKKGLTKPGVVVLQSLFIALVLFLEVSVRSGVGVVTGIAICMATLGSVRFGRAGTAYVAAATAPLAFAFSALLVYLKNDGLHPSKLGVDFVASLASAAPYLLISASYAWLNFLRQKNPKAPAKSRKKI